MSYITIITCICGAFYSFHILPSHSLIRILQFYRQNMFDSSSFAKKEIEMEFKWFSQNQPWTGF